MGDRCCILGVWRRVFLLLSFFRFYGVRCRAVMGSSFVLIVGKDLLKGALGGLSVFGKSRMGVMWLGWRSVVCGGVGERVCVVVCDGDSVVVYEMKMK